METNRYENRWKLILSAFQSFLNPPGSWTAEGSQKTFFFLFVFVIAGLTKSKRLVFDGYGSWLWVLLGSQWFLSIVYFADAIRHFLRGDEDGSFLKTVAYAACYSLIPILFSIGFWYFLGNAHRNFNSQKPLTGQDER